MAAGSKRKASTDQFGNPRVLARLNLPKEGGDARIEGLLIGYLKIRGKLYRIQVSGTDNPKSDGHRGWLSMTYMNPAKRPRRSRNSGDGDGGAF